MKTAVTRERKAAGRPKRTGTSNRTLLKVICCANMEAIEGFTGRTVGEVETQLREILNTNPEMRPEVDGAVADRNQVLTLDNEVLEFVRPEGTGSKG